jgi:CubicO group peptidase (beta-lactamase class C family)
LLTVSSTLTAQMANEAVHGRMADSIKKLFNTRHFKEIYQLTTSDFQKAIAEKDVVNLLENQIFFPLGKIEKLEFLKKNSEFYAYLLSFKADTVQLNIAVNGRLEVAYLQLLPYKEPPSLKRLKYASDNKKITGLDSLVDKTLVDYMQSFDNCGIGIGITWNGTDYFYNYGEIKKDSGIPATKNTIYEIGSVTKTFCGLLLAQAVTEGKIALNADIRDYLPGKYPDLNYKGKPILIEHLANHTCGLERIPANLITQPDFDSLNPYKRYTRQMLFDYLKHAKLNNSPGTVCDYSNMGMALLGIILEEVYGQSFEKLVKEKICLPNNMNSTGIHLSNDQLARFAEGYNQDGTSTPHWDLGDFAAAGALRSTVVDMLAYLKYNLAEPDSATKLAHESTHNSRENIGLAWFIQKTKQGNTLFWHNGGTYGFSGFTGFIPEKKCALVILGNSGTNVDYIGIAILKYLQK